MKKEIHRADTRGYAYHGWLRSYHSFSFASYHNPQRMHFGALRVFNDDIVAPSRGFGQHPHDNMEIISIPLKGSLEHEDNNGNRFVIEEDDVQIMSAGTGIQHSEKNHSAQEEVNFFQIWVMPKIRNIPPRYQQMKFSPEERKNKLVTVVSPDESDAHLWINQDAWFSRGNLEKGKSIKYKIKKEGNGIYLFVVSGSIRVEGEELERRDAIGLEDVLNIKFTASEDAEVLLIEVPVTKLFA